MCDDTITIKGVDSSSNAFNWNFGCTLKGIVTVMQEMIGAEGRVVWEHIL